MQLAAVSAKQAVAAAAANGVHGGGSGPDRLQRAATFATWLATGPLKDVIAAGGWGAQVGGVCSERVARGAWGGVGWVGVDGQVDAGVWWCVRVCQQRWSGGRCAARFG